MINYKNPLVALLILICFSFAVKAQDMRDASEAEYKNKILFLPAIGSSPETGFMFGAVVVPQFKMRGSGAETRSSSIFFSGIYTTKKQILLSLVPDLIFRDEQWMVSGNYYINYFPESYWGVGPHTQNSDELTVIYTEANLEQKVLRKMKPGFFTGPYLRWNRLYKVRFEDTEGAPISSPTVRGASGHTSVGVGWISRWDRRNSNMTPTRNHFVEFSLLGNPSWLGSTNSYVTYRLDARKYLDLRGDARSVLAFQALATLISGDPPFHNMATVGGDRINRGYYGGRYRDQNSIQLQSEYRRNIIGRLGLSLFAATGEVWDRFSEFSMSNYKWTAGGGLRFNLNKDDPTNIRIDYGFGKNTSGFYLQFGEAF